MKNFKKSSTFFMIMLLITSLSFTTFATEREYISKLRKLEEDMNSLGEMATFIKNEYLYEVTYEDLVENMYRGMMTNLDAYSTYYSKAEYETFLEESAGQSIGIGIGLKIEGGQVIVSEGSFDSPAYKAGIRAEDIILAIDDKEVTTLKGMELLELLKGQAGTLIKIKVRRGTETLTFNVVREVINTVPVESYMIDNEIGYIRITGFADNTYDLVKEELSKLDKKNAQKLIIDLRDNLGGSVESVVDVLSLFVTEGPVVYIRYVNRKTEVYESYLKKQKYKLAVLVNGQTASAAEIFTGAVKDKKEGVIVGTRTYGKGVVQDIYQLENGSAIKITSGEYLTPSKKAVQDIGITPHYVVQDTRGQAKIDCSKYPTIDKSRVATSGMVGLDVLAAEMMLETLGYKVDKPDGVFDDTTVTQLKAFQSDGALMPSGMLDFKTQDSLVEAFDTYVTASIEDAQLKAAIDLFKKG